MTALAEETVRIKEKRSTRRRSKYRPRFGLRRAGARHGPGSVEIGADPGASHLFQAKPGVMRAEGLAGMKWIGVIPPAPNGGQTISSLIVLSDLNSGAPVAVIGGDWITAARTAAMTAIAAQKLARADSTSIGFLGCGVQARSHFDALRLVLPGLKELVACSRSAASAERFAAMARGAGLAARTTREPRQAVEGMDVVITTVPEGAEVLEFLDTAWVAPGAFVSAVDLARS